jgi:hypothetical protein
MKIFPRDEKFWKVLKFFENFGKVFEFGSHLNHYNSEPTIFLRDKNLSESSGGKVKM